jgi:hypothetical protein
MADDSGGFTLPRGGGTVRVRRLGYAPAVVDLDTMPAPVVVRLAPLAQRLATVAVDASPPRHCLDFTNDADAEALATAVAEQFLRSAIVLRGWRERVRVSEVVTRITRDSLHMDPPVALDLTDLFAPYRIGHVLEPARVSTRLNIPTALDFADDRFRSAHCWRHAEPEVVESDTTDVVRFSPLAELPDPDVRGRIGIARSTRLPRWIDLEVTRVDSVRDGFRTARASLVYTPRSPWVTLPHTLEITLEPVHRPVIERRAFRQYWYRTEAGEWAR